MQRRTKLRAIGLGGLGGLVLAGALLAPRTARADVDPGFQETCTVAKAQGAGEDCVLCRAYYRNPNHCQNTLRATPFVKKCRSAGASVWREVWCQPRTNPPLSDGTRGNLLEPEVDAAAAIAAPPPAPEPSAQRAPDLAPEPTPDAATPVATSAPAASPPRTGACGACQAPGQPPPGSAALGAAGAAAAALVVRALTRCTRARSRRR